MSEIINMDKKVLLVLLLMSSCVLQAPPAEDTMMELPAVGGNELVIEHKGYTVNYNRTLRIPNWVAYELTDEETRGESQRSDRMFRKDPELKGTQAMREDYSGSGWTKGHMAPAADFRWDDDAMDETFYLSNVCPQSEELNSGDWEYLERQVRNWARRYGKAWVVSGPIVGADYETIGERDVAVPESFFKAVLVHDGISYSSIAFIMGNDAERYYLRDCAVSINELEKKTGFDFFPALDDSFEEEVESDVDLQVWSIR